MGTQRMGPLCEPQAVVEREMMRCGEKDTLECHRTEEAVVAAARAVVVAARAAVAVRAGTEDTEGSSTPKHRYTDILCACSRREAKACDSNQRGDDDSLLHILPLFRFLPRNVQP